MEIGEIEFVSKLWNGCGLQSERGACVGDGRRNDNDDRNGSGFQSQFSSSHFDLCGSNCDYNGRLGL